jgi:uroporphyrinogen decarboxylase
MHCDGDVTELLEMWVEAGIEAHHPLEARCGLDPLEVKEQFAGRLAIIGGLDNCNILPRGDRDEVRRHIKRVLAAGRGGGLIIAPHTIGADMSIETMDYVLDVLEEYGWYPLDSAGAEAN